MGKKDERDTFKPDIALERLVKDDKHNTLVGGISLLLEKKARREKLYRHKSTKINGSREGYWILEVLLFAVPKHSP